MAGSAEDRTAGRPARRRGTAPVTAASDATAKAARPDDRRGRILEAARAVFESEGIEGASMRAIGARAGYTAAALYFHFASKEAVYAALLEQSLDDLAAGIAAAADAEPTAERRLVAACLAFYDFYALNPRDLDLGFYLFRGGMKRRGLSPDLDQRLNARLLAALAPIDAAARALGAPDRPARDAAASAMAQAAGLLLLVNTGRLELFGSDSRRIMQRHAEMLAADLTTPGAAAATRPTRKKDPP